MAPNKLRKKLQPDFERMRKVLLRKGIPDRVPFAEYYVDQQAAAQLLGEKCAEENNESRGQMELFWLQRIRFYQAFGMDFVFVPAIWQAPKQRLSIEATDNLLGKRAWVSENKGPITNEEEFAEYPWPRPEDVNYRPLEFVSRSLPDGMKIISNTDGPFETVRELMGFETFAFAILEKPDFVKSLFDRVGTMLLDIHRHIVEIENIGAVHIGDDMCYKQGPMISPELLRKHVFPWHKKIADNAHARGIPFTLHSDGNNDRIMDDLISFVGIDGKHAFEDAAQPVEEVKRKYGDRVSLIGGMDLDFLCRSDENIFRQRVRSMIETCGSGGGYAFGTGTGLTTYTPLERYALMFNEALDVI